MTSCNVLHGEWWFLPSGDTLSADGDIGPVNHEMCVVSFMLQQLVDKLLDCEHPLLQQLGTVLEKQQQDEYARYDYVMARTTILDMADSWSRESQLPVSAEEDIYEWICQTLDIDREDLDVALFNSFADSDVRDYASSRLGWVRVKGNDIEMWHLSSHKLKLTADCLFATYEAAALQATYGLEWQFPTSGYCCDIPFRLLETGNVGAIRLFNQKQRNEV